VLDVSDIHQIEVIAELGSISKAAEVLNVSQPTLSKRISRLEQVLNITLFHRTSNGMLPTEAASHIIRSGQPLKHQIHTIERDIELMCQLDTGELHLGVGPIMEQLLFPEVLLQFTRQAPKVKISIRTEDAEDLLTLLQEAKVDVVVGPFIESQVPETMVMTRVIDYEVICVVRPDHPLVGQTSVGQDDLTNYPLIAPRATATLIDQLPATSARLEPQITCENYTVSKTMVMHSDYVTGGPESIFRQELDEGKLVALPVDTGIRWSAACVTRPESLHSPLVKALLEVLLGVAKAIR
jgi:LysR family transcriptional regulator, regulator of abg operon